MPAVLSAWQLDRKKKKKKGIETFPVGEELVGFESLTPSQQAASQALLAQLTGGLEGAAPFEYPSFEYPPPPAYEGVSPTDIGSLQDMLSSMPGLSPEVQQTLSTLMAGAGAQPEQTLEEIIASIPTFGGELGGETQSALASALSGEFPEEYFQASIAGPARERFEEETAPAIREEFGGPGTFWGTARAEAVTREGGKVERNLAAIRGELGNQAQQRSLQAAVVSMNARQNQINMAIQELSSQRNYASAQQVTALNAAISQLENQQNNQIAAANELNRLSQGKYQEMAQAQQQYQFGQAQAQQLHLAEMQTAYNAYTQQNPAMAEYLQAALSYLNIPMLATYQPYEEGGGAGPWGMTLPSLERPPGAGTHLVERLRG